VKLANQGIHEAIKNDPALAKGVNVYKGKVTYQAVAEALDLEYTPLASIW
jgi:alanine dehydrogenase